MGLITSITTLDVLVFICSIVFAIYVYMTRNFNYWKEKGIKSRSTWCIFGNATKCIFAKETPDELMRNIYTEGQGEKIFGFYVLDQPYLMIRDPEIIRNVLVKDFSNFSNKLLRTGQNDVLGAKNLFMIHNPPWKYIRRKMSPVFSPAQLKKMFPLMLKICNDLQAHLETYEIDDQIGKTIEVKELAAKFTTDLIGTTAFGLQFNSLKNPDAEFRNKGRSMFQNEYKRYLQYLTIFLIPSLRFLTKPYFFGEQESAFLRHSFWLTLNERLKTGNRRNDVIDSLIDLQKDQEKDINDAYKLEGDELLAQAAGFFFAGFETSSTATAFTFYELARNADTQKRLREEILAAMDETDGQITFEMVSTLPYLDAVFNEVLRMHPLISWLDRVPENDYTLPGTNITIKKGTPFILPMKMLQNDPQHFPNPEKFNPERFLEENKKNITPYTYFPLGEGPRNCLGGRLGFIQSKLALVQILSNYEVSPCEETQIPIEMNRYSVLEQPDKGIHLNFRRLHFQKV